MELRDIRAFREAAAAVAQLPDAQVRYSPQLAKFWMWAQTGATVFLACRVPTGARRAVGRGMAGLLAWCWLPTWLPTTPKTVACMALQQHNATPATLSHAPLTPLCLRRVRGP